MRKRIMTIGIGILLGWIVVMGVLSFFSRKPDSLGLHEGKLAACPASPNCVCSDHDSIEPLAYEGDAADAWKRLVAVVATQPRTKIVTEEVSYMHAECTSMVFRFVDDLEFRLDSDNKRIQVRSASRIGHSDFGVNRARVETIRQAFSHDK